MFKINKNTLSKNLEKFQKNKARYILFSLIFILLSFLLIFCLYFQNRILPGVKVLGLKVGGKTVNEASCVLSNKITYPETVELISDEKTFQLSLKEISLSYDFEKTANEALNAKREFLKSKNLLTAVKFLFKNQNIEPFYSIDNDKLNEYLQVVSEEVLSEPTFPEVYLENNSLFVNKGSTGEVLDKNAFLAKLDERIKNANFEKINIPLEKIDPSLSDEEAVLFQKRAEKIIGSSFSLTNEYDTYKFDDETIFSFLDYREEYKLNNIKDFIQKEIAPKVERQPQNAVLNFKDGKVTEFTPAKDGLLIDEQKLIKELIDNLRELEKIENDSFTLEIPVKRSAPEITLNEVNNLGIKELLGRGTSTFRGSISGRIHNISLASSKFNGVLVTPGETFSFNKTLGDVSAFTGYKQAYIIKDGRTVLGDGGGVCQVSTTLFRAILDAGLPVNERRAHSYRVSYYEQGSPPGLDATVFDPTTDLKFTNDTPGHLLIQTEFDAKNYSLVFEIYGTDDGRIATTTKPVITSSTPPPEDLYIDDPTLPEGTVKQIDYKSWGAKVVFDYSVKRNSEIIFDKTFVSNYHPWQAVFLRGTGPIN